MMLLLIVLFYSITTFSASSPLTAGEVTFDNNNTPLLADNVQGAVNEIFQHATDYNEIKTTIGTSTLTTTDQTLKGAINEINTQLIDKIYPVGSVYISFNSTMPTYLTAGKTWVAITGDYVLKTTTTETGGTLNAAGNTGSHVLTINEIPSHRHSYTRYDYTVGVPSGSYTAADVGSKTAYTDYVGGGQGHTHTAGMPQNVAIYMWKRTA